MGRRLSFSTGMSADGLRFWRVATSGICLIFGIGDRCMLFKP